MIHHNDWCRGSFVHKVLQQLYKVKSNGAFVKKFHLMLS